MKKFLLILLSVTVAVSAAAGAVFAEDSLATAAIPLAGTVEANLGATWYVDDNSCPGTGNGTQQDPFCSIQDAIDVASDGDTIIVAEGTYEENLNVSKPVTIDGQETATLTAGTEDGFRVTASNATITGFTIIGQQAFNNAGIMIGGNYPGDMAHLGVQNVTVSNNVFMNSWSAIYVWKSSNNLITENEIRNSTYHAIEILDGRNTYEIQQGYPSQNNRIIANEVHDSWYGLYVGAWGSSSMMRTDNSGTVIQDNHFHDLKNFAVAFGLTNSTGIDISGNTIENNGYGICEVWWPASSNLTGATVTGNRIDSNSYGIVIATGNQWTIEDNDITNSSAVGIYIMESEGTEAHNNNIAGNGLYGVQNIGANVVDATKNFWGSPQGPYRELPNGKWIGKGDKVSTNVTCTPWSPH